MLVWGAEPGGGASNKLLKNWQPRCCVAPSPHPPFARCPPNGQSRARVADAATFASELPEAARVATSQAAQRAYCVALVQNSCLPPAY